MNVVDRIKLRLQSEHPHGLPDADFDSLFTTDKPVIFNFHGYPSLIHKLTYKRVNHDYLHVHGTKKWVASTCPYSWQSDYENGIDRPKSPMEVATLTRQGASP